MSSFRTPSCGGGVCVLFHSPAHGCLGHPSACGPIASSLKLAELGHLTCCRHLSLPLEGIPFLPPPSPALSPGRFSSSLNRFYHLHFSLWWDLTCSQALRLSMSGEEGVFSVYSEAIPEFCQPGGRDEARLWQEMAGLLCRLSCSFS